MQSHHTLKILPPDLFKPSSLLSLTNYTTGTKIRAIQKRVTLSFKIFKKQNLGADGEKEQHQ
jgi:hypothetical protein